MDRAHLVSKNKTMPSEEALKKLDVWCIQGVFSVIINILKWLDIAFKEFRNSPSKFRI